MAPCTKILCLILVLVCTVEATRESRFFNKDPAYTNNPNAAGYMDSKEYFPTTTYNSYNGQGSREWQDNNQGYREGVNGYGKGGEYATDNGAGAGYGGEGSAKYGSGEWHGTNGGGYGQGGQYGSGYGGGSGSNGAYGSGYNTDFGNGNGYGGGSGNGNGEYVGNNAYNQQNP